MNIMEPLAEKEGDIDMEKGKLKAPILISATTAIAYLQELEDFFTTSGKHENAEARRVLAKSASEIYKGRLKQCYILDFFEESNKTLKKKEINNDTVESSKLPS